VPGTVALDRTARRHIPSSHPTEMADVAGVSFQRISPAEELADQLDAERHVARVPDADHPRLKLLYERYWKDLCRYVRATFGSGQSDPQDVAQTAFTRYLAVSDPAAVENPRAFLYTTARNIALDVSRHRKHERRYSLAAASEEGATHVDECSPERITLAEERAAALAAVIENLPRRQRQALLLNRLHDLSYSEIALRIGSSKSDVRRQIARALEAIELAMDPYQ
jgi:RNA polymerase sigma factor (sigma-70 family)